MKVLQVIVLVCLAVILAVAAYASDADFGSYARIISMGGAGLALSDNASDTAVVNPAAGAASGARLRFMWPSVDYATRGATISELRDRTSEISDTDTTDALTLAEDFGDHQTKLYAAVTAGVMGSYGVTFDGEAQGVINPGPLFRDWVRAGHPTTGADLTAFLNGQDINAVAADLTGGTYVTGAFVYDAPAISYGRGFGAGGGKLWIGGKAKWLRSEVHTWDFVTTVTGPNSIQLDAVERPAQKDSGFGMDLGFIFQPQKSRMQYGMVLNNFVEPKLKGVDSSIKWSLGAACKLNRKFTVATDLININRANNEGAEFRMGAEWRPVGSFALRGGFSGNEFTWGFGYMGMNFAFSPEAPGMISRTLSF